MRENLRVESSGSVIANHACETNVDACVEELAEVREGGVGVAVDDCLESLLEVRMEDSKQVGVRVSRVQKHRFPEFDGQRELLGENVLLVFVRGKFAVIV